MPSTPMHVVLYNAFKWTPPHFGHVPLLVDKSGQKLSKRNADIDLSSFKDQQGIFPATLVNFAALLGWSHTQKADVFSLKELEQIVSALVFPNEGHISNLALSSISKLLAETLSSPSRSFGSFRKHMPSVLQQVVAPSSMRWSRVCATQSRRHIRKSNCQFFLLPLH